MSGNQPKLPPGISLQRTQAAPPPNLPPGISIQRSGDTPKLPSGIQVQRSSDSSGMDRLAGLGIQVSRSAQEKSQNHDMDRLSRLGISVSSGQAESTMTPPGNRSPAPVPDRLSQLGVSISGGPRTPNLPPGMSISGGPRPQGNGPRLPPGVNISGGPKTTQNLPPGTAISGGPRNSTGSVPPGVSVSGGPRPQGPNTTGGPRPQMPPGVNISGGPRPQGNPPGSVSGGPRLAGPRASLNQGNNVNGSPRPNLPAGVQVSGGPRPNLPTGVQLSGGPRQNLPAGVQLSGGPRPNLPTGVQISRGPRPSLPAGVQINVSPRPGLPPGVNSGVSPTQGDPKASPKPGTPNLPPVSAGGGLANKSKGDNTANKSIDNGPQDSDSDSDGSIDDSIPKENGEITPGTEEQSEEGKEVEKAQKEKGSDEGQDDEEEDMETEESTDKEKNKNANENEEKDVESSKEPEDSENKDETGEKEGSAPSDKGAKKPTKGEKTKENGIEEGWEGYEGEEGWEEYEEGEGGEAKNKDSTAAKETKDDSKEGTPNTEDKDKEKEKEEEGEKDKNEVDASEDANEEFDEEMEEEDSESSVSKDTDGAPKEPPISQQGNTDHISNLGNISISRLSKDDDDAPGKKLPPGISMSSVPSLPPGISISSQGSSAPSNLPPGISISPFKKPSFSARHSVDDDSRSVNSMERDHSFSREDSDAVSVRSYSEYREDPLPQVGTETTCIFCNNRCLDRSPKLLTCLHTACSQCFEDKIRISIRDNSANDVVDLDGDDVQMAPEVTCNVCKTSTSEDEVMDNYFVVCDEEDDQDKGLEDQNFCASCEENAIATSKCNDCDEFLCNDCVRAHQRVKMTKDHEITQVASYEKASANINYCDVHRNEKLTLFCESCDTLNCRDCQLSERHRNHKYRYSYEVAPEVKATFMQSISDIKLKRNGLEESRQTLVSKISEVNSKENDLLAQLRDIKSYLVTKIENRHRDLVTEITKQTREKRKLLEGRKSNLDRTYWQADNAIAFVKHVLGGNVSDEKMLLSKKMMSRQMKRLRRANNSINLGPTEMEMKLEIYFQHFTGQALHTNLDSVLKMIMSDIKASSVPIEAPKPKAPPPPASPVRQPPSTPTRGMPPSPQGVPRTSPARLNSGMVNRQLGTPQKQIVGRSPAAIRQGSPAKPMMNQQGRNMGGARMQVMQGQRMNQPNRGGRGRGQVVQQGVRLAGAANRGGMMGGRGGQVMGQQNRGRPAARGMITNQGVMRGGAQNMNNRGRAGNRGGPLAIRGPAQPMNRGGMQMGRGNVQAQRGRGVGLQQIRGGGMQQQPRMIKPAGGRGRPAGQGNMMVNTNNQFSNSGSGALQIQPITYQPQQRPQKPGQTIIKSGQVVKNVMPGNISTSPGSSWHTPTSANRPVSPPQSTDISSFKIKLPKMGGQQAPVKEEDSQDIISFDGDLPAKIVRPNGAGNVNDALANLNRTGIQISRQDEGVDPVSVEENSSVDPASRDIKSETGPPAPINPPRSQPRPIMEGSAEGGVGGGGGGGGRKEKADGDWCAVCHDGGDTLYCCDRCPKVYHLFCYVPPLTAEPADDWVCLMCSTIEEILSLPTKVKKGRGNLSERDLKLCRRLLFEMYNLWPESVPFRDCADLNFPQYLDKIKDPIALDVIKERLDEENPDQYSSVRAFLADLRKMFRNCFLFNSKESEIYRHAKKLEEKLDQLLQMWLPEFAFDPLTDLVDNTKGTKRPPSPQPGPSKKKRSNDSPQDYMGKIKDKKKKKKKRKKRNRDSDDNHSESDSDEISEGERERQEYLTALQMSLQGEGEEQEQDNDPQDGDFEPPEEPGKGKGKGKGRGKGKKVA